MKRNTLKKSTNLLSIIFNIASVIAIIVDSGAVILLGGTLLSQFLRPGYLAKQMINAEMELVFSEWIFLYLVCPLYPYYHISVLSIIEGILIILIFNSITLIFKYGCGLQKEIDETL